MNGNPSVSQNQKLHVVLGTGPLARATAEALFAQGLQVRLLSRSASLPNAIPGLRVVRADLLDLSGISQHVQGASAIYFCAQPAYHKWPSEFPALQRAAIDAAADAGAWLIVAENLYGYGPSGIPVVETTPLRPTTIKGRVRAEMHEALMNASVTRGLPVSVARGSDFFGPYVDSSAVGRRAFDAIVAGRTVDVVGKPDAPHAYTYIRDFGAALAVLGTNDKAIGEVWHVPNASAVSTRRFFEIAARLVGKPLRLRRMSRLEMLIIGQFVRPIWETIEMLYEFEAPFFVNDSKFKTAFGDISTPLEAALADTLSWLGSTRQGK